MTRTVPLAVAALVLVATVGALPVLGAATAGFSAPASAAAPSAQLAANGTAANATNGSVPPGAMLSGVIGVQEAEIEGEVETRAFGIAVASAATNTTKAEVVKQEVDGLRERVQRLERRKEALKQARENGSISNATYRARVAELAARSRTAGALANLSAEASRGLPAELLASKGINATAIATLRNRAANLTGPEVAAIARSIAGPDVGRSIARNKTPVDIGPPGDAPAGPGGNVTPPAGNATGGNGPGDGPPDNRTRGDNTTAGNTTRGGGNGSGSGSGSGGSGSGR